MNLLFSVNKRYIPLLLSCVHSITLRGGAANYNVYILHTDLTPENKRDITAKTGPQIMCHFISVPKELFEGFPVTKRYPLEIYYRLAAPLLLPQKLDRILYLDVDTIVINPLDELYQTDFTENCFAACSHTKALLDKINQFRLKTEQAVPYVNTGVLLMNLPALREQFSLTDVRQYVQEQEKRLILPDQDVLTALYGDRVKVMDTLRYNLSDRVLMGHNSDLKNQKLDLDWVRRNGVIIHYFGKNKPWGEHYLGILDVFYREYGLPV